jgi:ATP/ADP translocase
MRSLRRAKNYLYQFVSKSFAIPIEQISRVLYHGIFLAFIIAGFWLLDSLKDPVLSSTVGIEYQPVAKLLSVVTTLIVVCLYDFLTTVVSKPMLFHVISIVYSLLMMMLSGLLADPETGLSDKLKVGPHRWIGWLTYCLVESYGSLTVALFWSFTNSLMNLEEAKGAYGLIIAIAQIGAIVGSTLASYAAVISIPGLFILGSIFISCVSLLAKYYYILFRDYSTEQMKTKIRSVSECSVDPHLPALDVPQESPLSSFNITSSSTHRKNEESYLILVFSSITVFASKVFRGILTVFAGFYEGLSLIIQYHYVLKLFAVSCVYDIVVTIMDYEFKITGAKHTIVDPQLIPEEILSSHHTGGHITDKFANLLGHFGQLTNFISLVLSFFGFSFLVHHIGIQKTLLIFPFTLLVAVTVISLVPSIWVLFFFVSLLKGMVFSLHDPAKELLYIPTSEAVKYKAKAWIDVFGSRLAKAVGSMITFYSFGNISLLRRYSEIPILILTGLTIYLTWSIGNDFQDLVDKHQVVGEENLFSDSSPLVISPNPNIIVGPTINGLKPGDVGYTGYDPHLFDGVFDDDEFQYNINELHDFHPNLPPFSSYGRHQHQLHHHHPHHALNRPHSTERRQQHMIHSIHSPINAFEFFGKTEEDLYHPNSQQYYPSVSDDNNVQQKRRIRTKSAHI